MEAGLMKEVFINSSWIICLLFQSKTHHFDQRVGYVLGTLY